MAKSDMEDTCDSPGVADGRKSITDVDENWLDKNEKRIHSGQFMVSCVQDPEEGRVSSTDELLDAEVVDPKGFDFGEAVQEPTPTYQFGGHAEPIDGSLTKLFECMTLAYSGKLTSPKWKNFKGIKLRMKEKIRLNNIIWREWHMQFIQGQRPIVCQFEPPIQDKMHVKPEAVVMEGKYWKRKLHSVTSEYQKWRLFFKKHFTHHFEDPVMMQIYHIQPSFNDWYLSITCPQDLIDDNWTSVQVLNDQELLDRVAMRHPRGLAQPASMHPFSESLMDEDFSMDFTDTLFTTLNQPFSFPSPREMCQLGNADIIQPGLVQLQPSLDEFMDTLEPLPPLQEMFGGRFGFPDSTTQEPPVRPLSAGDFLLDSNVGVRTSAMERLLMDPPAELPRTSKPVVIPDSTTPPPQQLSQQTLLRAATQPAQPPQPQLAQPRLMPRATVAQSGPSMTTPSHLGHVLQNLLPESPHALNVAQFCPELLQQLTEMDTIPATSTPTPMFTARGGSPARLALSQQSMLQSLSTPIMGSTLLQQPALSQAQQLPQQILLPPPQTTMATILHQGSPQTITVTNTIQQTDPLTGQTFNVVFADAVPSSPTITPQQPMLLPKPPAQPQPQPQTFSQTTFGSSQPQLLPKLSPTSSPVSLLTQPCQVTSATSLLPSAPQLQNLLQQVTTSQQPTPAPAAADSSPTNMFEQMLNKARSRPAKTRQLLRTQGSWDSMTVHEDQARRSSTGSISKHIATRKHGGFLVPQSPQTATTSSIRPGKQRTIPQTSAKKNTGVSASQQNTFLAQLLKGTQPVALPSHPVEPKPKGRSASAGFLPQASAASALTVTTAANIMPHTHSAPIFNHGHSQPVALSPPPGDQVQQLVNDPILSDAVQSQGVNVAQVANSPLSPQSFQVPSPSSSADLLHTSVKSPYSKADFERPPHKEQRRATHTTAEQKRRCNIKCGFDTLHKLVPALSQNPNTKISKAQTLQKGADFCRKLKEERTQMQEEADQLRKEIETLNNSISLCQAQLPATGAPVTRQHTDRLRDMFDEYVRNRTLQNWKFYIFSIIIRPLYEAYNSQVTTTSVEDLSNSVLAWLEQHCSLVALRPAVLNSLRLLSTTTSILTDPSKVPAQAAAAVTKKQPPS